MSVEIRNKREEIEEQIDSLHKDLERLQRKCKHKNASKTYRGPSGNYDGAADGYWIDYHCEDCGHRWTTSQ